MLTKMTVFALFFLPLPCDKSKRLKSWSCRLSRLNEKLTFLFSWITTSNGAQSLQISRNDRGTMIDDVKIYMTSKFVVKPRLFPWSCQKSNNNNNNNNNHIFSLSWSWICVVLQPCLFIDILQAVYKHTCCLWLDRSLWVEAYNSTIFLLRRFHRPIYF